MSQAAWIELCWSEWARARLDERGSWSRFLTFHCILLYFLSFSSPLSFNLDLLVFHCCPASLLPSRPLFLSLFLHYWYRTHLWIFLISRELMTSLLSLLSQSLSFLFICLLSLYSFPSGYAADKVSLHRTNTTITFPPFFIACPPYSAKLLLRCSSILQMNCLDNLIFLLLFLRSRGAREDLSDGGLITMAGSLISGRKSH